MTQYLMLTKDLISAQQTRYLNIEFPCRGKQHVFWLRLIKYVNIFMYIRTFACTMKNKNFILIHKKQTSLITVKLNENCRNVKKNLKKKI